MTNFRRLFCDIAAGKRVIEIVDDEGGDPDEAIRQEVRQMTALMFDSPVEYYGPGAAEANARRAAELARRAEAERHAEKTNDTPPESHTPEKKKRRRMTKRERLEAKAAALRAEIEALEK